MFELSNTIWYADQPRAEGMFKVVVHSDKGSLSWMSGRLVFRGRKSYLQADRVLAMRLARQVVPWPSYAIVTVALLGYFTFLGWPFPAVVLVTAASDLFGLFVAYQTKWVKIDYVDQVGVARRAYFADSSMRGWGGIFGGTSMLYRRICAALMTPPIAGPESDPTRR